VATLKAVEARMEVITHQIFPVLRGQALLQADDPLAASLVCVVLSVQHRDFACSRIKIEKNREGKREQEGTSHMGLMPSLNKW
jgi:hypothetical protein